MYHRSNGYAIIPYHVHRCYSALMLVLIFILLFLISPLAHAVHACDANVKVDGATLSSNCLKTTITRTASGAITTGSNNQVIQNLNISNGSGDCITVNHTGVIIKNNSIGSCSGNGVKVNNGGSGVTIQYNNIHDVGLSAVETTSGGNSGTVYLNRFFHNRIDVHTTNTGGGWIVEHNHFIDGNPGQACLRGQGVQPTTTPTNMNIRCNRLDNTGISGTAINDCNATNPDQPGGCNGDGFSVNHFINGSSSNKMYIRGNMVRYGTAAQTSSVPINPGDHLADQNLPGWGYVERNVMIKESSSCSGFTGMGGGHDFTWIFNVMAGTNRNVGYNPPIELTNQSGSTTCTGNTASDNKSYALDKNGTRQDGRIAGHCGTPAGWSTNDWNEPSYTHPDGTVYNLTNSTGRLALYNGNSLYQSCNACSDGKDNDGDGKTDFGSGASNDAGCTSAWSNNEDPAVSGGGGCTATPLPETANRANESPLTNCGQWFMGIRPVDNNINLVSNTMRSASTFASGWWNADVFDANQFDQITLITKEISPAAQRYIALYTRIQSPDTANMDAYRCRIIEEPTPPDTFTIQRIDNNGTAIDLSAVTPQNIANGDSFRCRTVGGTTYAEIDPAGAPVAWTVVVSATDTACGGNPCIAGSGYAGFGIDDPLVVDDFNAGTLSLSAPPAIMKYLLDED